MGRKGLFCLKFIDEKEVLKLLDAPEPQVLESWCIDNDFEGVLPTQESQVTDHTLAAALWYARTNYPEASLKDICSFGALVAYLSTGFYAGFGTDEYEKERRAESIVISLAGGTADAGLGFIVPGDVAKSAPTKEFTERIFSFLDKFYFADEGKALVELSAKNALDLVRIGELMTVTDVAKKYKLSDRNVREACKYRLTRDEAVSATFGWLITRAGAERLWGNKA